MLKSTTGCIYVWMKYNKMNFVIEVFENTTEINKQQFIDGRKKVGSNLNIENIARIFDKYSPT